MLEFSQVCVCVCVCVYVAMCFAYVTIWSGVCIQNFALTINGQVLVSSGQVVK